MPEDITRELGVRETGGRGDVAGFIGGKRDRQIGWNDYLGRGNGPKARRWWMASASRRENIRGRKSPGEGQLCQLSYHVPSWLIYLGCVMSSDKVRVGEPVAVHRSPLFQRHIVEASHSREEGHRIWAVQISQLSTYIPENFRRNIPKGCFGPSFGMTDIAGEKTVNKPSLKRIVPVWDQHIDLYPRT